MEESLRLHADEQAAVQTLLLCGLPLPAGARAAARSCCASSWRGAAQAAGEARLRATLKAHRRAARESLAFTEGIRSELDALALPTAWSTARSSSRCCGRASTRPGRPRHGRRATATEIFGELDGAVELIAGARGGQAAADHDRPVAA